MEVWNGNAHRYIERDRMRCNLMEKVLPKRDLSCEEVHEWRSRQRKKDLLRLLAPFPKFVMAPPYQAI